MRNAKNGIRKQMNPPPMVIKKIKGLNDAYSFVLHVTATTCSDPVAQVRALETNTNMAESFPKSNEKTTNMPNAVRNSGSSDDTVPETDNTVRNYDSIVDTVPVSGDYMSASMHSATISYGSDIVDDCFLDSMRF